MYNLDRIGLEKACPVKKIAALLVPALDMVIGLTNRGVKG